MSSLIEIIVGNVDFFIFIIIIGLLITVSIAAKGRIEKKWTFDF